MSQPRLSELGTVVLSAPYASPRVGAEGDLPPLPVTHMLVTGFVSALAAGLVVATLSIKRPR